MRASSVLLDTAESDKCPEKRNQLRNQISVKKASAEDTVIRGHRCVSREQKDDAAVTEGGRKDGVK